MTKHRFFLLLSLTLLLAACTAELPVVKVEGGLVQGILSENPSVVVYKGIPYAAPPVGELRWKAPQPVKPWEGVRVCDKWGAPSLQDPHTPGGYTEEFFFDGDPEFSEDCLYLNIWAPAGGENLPVTLWIHGGAFRAGWGFEPEMDGTEWAAHGGILVTCNYRLGVLGFLAHPLLSAESGVSGNYGLLDQIAALKWVRDNIAAFGGDPSRITIMGQSAGAMSVQALCASPLSKDLIAGAIIQSGGGISARQLTTSRTLPEAEAAGKAAMDAAGLFTLEQMREATPEQILAIRYPGFIAPVTDGYVLPETFSEAALAGRIADVPYMIGCTLDDIRGLDSGIEAFALEREKAGGVAYVYRFERRLPTDGRPDVLEGAFHSSELWYTFKSLRYCWRPFTPADYDLAEEMIGCWTNFAATGDPNGNGPGLWSPYSKAKPEFKVFDVEK